MERKTKRSDVQICKKKEQKKIRRKKLNQLFDERRRKNPR